jgi:hypothetical protein
VTDDLATYGLGALPDPPDKHGLGAVASPEDPRDFAIADHPGYAAAPATAFPSAWLEPNMPPVSNQGLTPMCVAYSSANDQEAVFERIDVLGVTDYTFTLTAQAKARGWDAAFGAGVVRTKEGRSGRGERRQATLRHLNVPASLPLEIDVTGTEPWLRRSTA